MKHLLFILAFFLTLHAAAQDYPALVNLYTKKIALDSLDKKSYYSRSLALFQLKKYNESLSDVNKAIQLSPDYTEALILRGKLNIQKEDKTSACKDFNLAKELGDTAANSFVEEYFCEYKPVPGENLVLDWPEKENWKITERFQEGTLTLLFLNRSNETSENWTEMAAMSAVCHVQGVPVVEYMNDILLEIKENSKHAKLTLIEKNETALHPWIIFSIENIIMKTSPQPESRVYYMIQGDDTFYTCYRDVKQKALNKEQKEKWTAFFKAAELVYE